MLTFRRLILFIALFALLLLWLISYYGSVSLTPPIWVALATTVLPYLYLALALLFLFFYILVRTKVMLVVFALLVVSVLWLWGGTFFPSTETAEEAKSIKLVAWNVQRMGEYTKQHAERTRCIHNTLREQQPDVLSLLEITAHQLNDLQKALGIPAHHCQWTDYYGTGRKRSAGLAACVVGDNKAWKIVSKRQLHLPPRWKYVYLEVQPSSRVSKAPLNIMTIHVAPPKITEKAVKNIGRDILQGEREGLVEFWRLLKSHERQVALQGNQVTDALDTIHRFRDPTIIAGDFNSTRDAALHSELRETLTDTWSQGGFGFGATRYWGNILPLRIDYLYVSREFAVQDAKTLSVECSDHRPVVSEVFIGGA